MVRYAVAGLAVLALAGAVAAEEDNGPTLIGLFAGTCALRPALPSELDRIASGLGFVGDGGPITPELERGPKIDIVYSGRMTRRGRSFGVMAYFFDEPGDGPNVSCVVETRGASADALPGLIERAFNPHDRADEPVKDGVIRANWRLGAAGGDDTLAMSVRRDSGLASIELKYRRRPR